MNRLNVSPIDGQKDALPPAEERARTAPSFQKARNEEDRGRKADVPGQIPKFGWWDILVRVKDQISRDNVSIVAAGVAFYGTLALFPALAALVSIYGLLTSQQEVQEQITSLSDFLPKDAQSIIHEQLMSISTSAESALSF